MSNAQDKRFVLVTRKTRMQELIERFNTWPQAKFYLEHNDVDAQDYLDEHDRYIKCIDQAERVLRSHGRFQLMERQYLPSYQFDQNDVVVTVGQDGLVANTLKYLNRQTLIGVNPDPDRWDGKLLPFVVAELNDVVERIKKQTHDFKTVTFAEAKTNLGQKMLAVNDLFIGPRSHTSAQYRLIWNGEAEAQSSSGIIVSTGFGSTGWFQSILAGAVGVMGAKSHPLASGFPWDAKKLYFSVREPFPSQTTGVDLTFGEIVDGTQLKLESSIPEAGVIFSDGVMADAIPFNSGCIAEIGVSEIEGILVC